MSPTLVKVTVVPALIRVRAGPKEYSTLLAPILILSAPGTIGPGGPATLAGGGGGHSGPSCPFSAKAQTASPKELPCSTLPPVAIGMNCSPSTSYTTAGASAPKPVWKLHSLSPVLASTATKLPSGSPRNNKPPAVTVEPPPPPMR